MSRQVGDQNIWERIFYSYPASPYHPYEQNSYYSILPDQLHDFKERIRHASDILAHFLKNLFTQTKKKANYMINNVYTLKYFLIISIL